MCVLCVVHVGDALFVLVSIQDHVAQQAWVIDVAQINPNITTQCRMGSRCSMLGVQCCNSVLWRPSKILTQTKMNVRQRESAKPPASGQPEEKDGRVYEFCAQDQSPISGGVVFLALRFCMLFLSVWPWSVQYDSAHVIRFHNAGEI